MLLGVMMYLAAFPHRTCFLRLMWRFFLENNVPAPCLRCAPPASGRIFVGEGAGQRAPVRRQELERWTTQHTALVRPFWTTARETLSRFVLSRCKNLYVVGFVSASLFCLFLAFDVRYSTAPPQPPPRPPPPTRVCLENLWHFESQVTFTYGHLGSAPAQPSPVTGDYE